MQAKTNSRTNLVMNATQQIDQMFNEIIIFNYIIMAVLTILTILILLQS